jgi:hypothetical protein
MSREQTGLQKNFGVGTFFRSRVAALLRPR